MTLRALIVLIIGLTAATTANAASIYLVQASNHAVASDGAILVSSGDEVTLDVWMDFSGPDEITLGGGYDVLFDSNLLAFDNWTQYSWFCFGDPCWIRDPDLLDGLLESANFGSFQGVTGPAVVAQVTFVVIGTGLSGDTTIGTSATNGIAGPFISGIDYVSELDVDFHGITLRAIPIPAAAWLLLSALCLGGGLVRRKAGV